jgi:hypothetical protein
MRVPPQLRTILDETGLPWEIRSGKKHFKVFVNDELVTVYSHNHRPSAKSRSFDYIRCILQRREHHGRK